VVDLQLTNNDLLQALFNPEPTSAAGRSRDSALAVGSGLNKRNYVTTGNRGFLPIWTGAAPQKFPPR
jgi:hypothetical protein